MEDKDKAPVSIGTLIIFIAMVLVATVAALVLLQTSGVLVERGVDRGMEENRTTSSSLIIRGIEGNVSGDNTIDLLKVKIGLKSGSAPVSVNYIVISITDGKTAIDLTNDSFMIERVLDEDGSLLLDNPAINSGDFVIIHAPITDLDLSPGTSAQVQLTPKFGAATIVSFQTPDSYGEKKNFFLYL